MIKRGIFCLLTVSLLSPAGAIKAEETSKIDSPPVLPKKSSSTVEAPVDIKPIINSPVGSRQTVPEKTLEQLNAEGLYMKQAEYKLRRHWYPPKGVNIKPVKIRFCIVPDGSVYNGKIIESSGNKEADIAALDALKKASPFDALPSGIPDELWAEFTFKTPARPLPATEAPKDKQEFGWVDDMQKKNDSGWIDEPASEPARSPGKAP